MASLGPVCSCSPLPSGLEHFWKEEKIKFLYRRDTSTHVGWKGTTSQRDARFLSHSLCEPRGPSHSGRVSASMCRKRGKRSQTPVSEESLFSAIFAAISPGDQCFRGAEIIHRHKFSQLNPLPHLTEQKPFRGRRGSEQRLRQECKATLLFEVGAGFQNYLSAVW